MLVASSRASRSLCVGAWYRSQNQVAAQVKSFGHSPQRHQHGVNVFKSCSAARDLSPDL